MRDSIHAEVYTIICFSDTSLPIADILTDLIVLTPYQDRSTETIPSILDVNLHGTYLRKFVHSKE